MGLCVLGNALVIIGGLISLGAVAYGILWLNARDWPTVNGVVRKAGIRTRRNPIGPGVVAEEYRASMVYEYEVDGQKYMGNKLKPYEGRLWTRERQQAERVLVDPGNRVSIKVSPRNPKKAVLDASIGRSDVDFLAVIGLTGLLVALVGYWVVMNSCGFGILTDW